MDALVLLPFLVADVGIYAMLRRRGAPRAPAAARPVRTLSYLLVVPVLGWTGDRWGVAGVVVGAVLCALALVPAHVATSRWLARSLPAPDGSPTAPR